MILSERVKHLLSSTRLQNGREYSHDQVRSFFKKNNLPIVDTFVDCLVMCGGLRVITKWDDVSFYSLEDIEKCDVEDLNFVFLENEHGKWFHALECRYPGLTYLHESGAIYFESDMSCKAFDSLSNLLETLALVSGYESQHDNIHLLNGYLKVNLSGGLNSVEKLVNQIGMEIDHDSSDSNAIWGRKENSLIELLHVDKYEVDAGCTISIFSPSRAEIFNLRSTLKPLLGYHTVDEI